MMPKQISNFINTVALTSIYGLAIQLLLHDISLHFNIYWCLKIKQK